MSSQADSWIYKGIELIPSAVFCQKIIDFCGEKISIHHRMRKALRPAWLGIPAEESVNKGKRKLTWMRLRKGLDSKQPTARFVEDTANAKTYLLSKQSFRERQ